MDKYDIYAYTMVWDTGFAPSVWSNVLSLACCKTFLRYKIGTAVSNGENIYIVGVCGSQLASRAGKRLERNFSDCFPVYIAKVTSVIQSSEYFSLKQFSNRPDAQYLYENDKWYYKKDNPHHETTGKGPTLLEAWEEEKDIMYIRGKSQRNKYNYVLLSKEYLYFGNKGDVIPEKSPELHAICEERKMACRADLSPIKCLDETAKARLLEFMKEYKRQYSKQTVKLLLDTPFRSGGNCKKERTCR